MSGSIREILETTFIHTRNKGVLIDEAEKEIQYLFDRQRKEYKMIIRILQEGIKKLS